MYGKLFILTYKRPWVAPYFLPPGISKHTGKHGRYEEIFSVFRNVSVAIKRMGPDDVYRDFW